MLERVLRFHRCIRHVPMRQLARRSWLTVKRSIAPHLPFTAPSQRPFLLSNSPLKRFMPARNEQVMYEGGAYHLALLGKTYDLTAPIDWKMSRQPKPNHLDRLAIHYHEFLESLPFDVAQAAILDWLKTNPWHEKAAWKLGWNCYAISIRSICWMQWLAEYSNRLDDQLREVILSSLSGQIRYLAGNLETDIGGNHLLKNISCVLWSGAFFDDPEIKQIADFAARQLDRQLDKQFLPDGMHFELSPAYHCQVFVDLLHCRVALSTMGEETAKVDAALAKAAQVIADLAHPDGYISLFSDAGLTMAYAPHACLAAYTALSGAAVTSRNQFCFPDSGYYGLRTDRTYFAADCGPSCADALPAHGHGDMLAFEWDVLDKRVIVDMGVYEYESGELRAKSRTARSHNTLTVGNRDQCEFIDSFRVGNRSHAICESAAFSDNQLTLEGHHLGFSTSNEQVLHRRRFEITDDGVKVFDAVEGGAGEPAIARLLLHDDCKVNQLTSQQLQIERDGMLVQLSTTAGAMKIAPACWFPNFGEARDTHQIEIDYGLAPCSGSFILKLLRTGTT
jgi:uncharacterized heparinase superfamily protein